MIFENLSAIKEDSSISLIFINQSFGINHSFSIIALESIKLMSKIKRNAPKSYRYTASEVADLCGVSEGYVKKIRAKMVNLDTHKAQQVLMVDETLYDGCTALLNEVNRILNPSTN